MSSKESIGDFVLLGIANLSLRTSDAVNAQQLPHRIRAVPNHCVRHVLKERVHLFWVQCRSQNGARIIKRYAIEELMLSSLRRRAICGVETLDVMDIVHQNLAVRMLLA